MILSGIQILVGKINSNIEKITICNTYVIMKKLYIAVKHKENGGIVFTFKKWVTFVVPLI